MGILIQSDQELKTVSAVLHVFDDSMNTLRLEEDSIEIRADIAICARLADFLKDGAKEYGGYKNIDSSTSSRAIAPLD